jgi:predicted secreted protein
MLRDKKIVLLSHCFLNVNAKVYGLANYQGALEDLIRFLLAEGFGLIQLPCRK